MPDESDSPIIACSAYFNDRGLQLDAEKMGVSSTGSCPNCGSIVGKMLTKASLETLAHRFFVWGSLRRAKYGAAPAIQFNAHQRTSLNVSQRLRPDIALFERILGVGFFPYGPRLWMVGEIEPLKKLQNRQSRDEVIDRILYEYPVSTIDSEHLLYRVRKSPTAPAEPTEYDSPPASITSRGRLNAVGSPVLYASADLQICIHECRATAEDDLYVATLAPSSSLRLLNLSMILQENNVTEFESLDMAVHMLFLAGRHSYKISCALATATQNAGFDGIIYPSYFSLARQGSIPFPTFYGISHRRIPRIQEIEQKKSIPNVAIFGRPIEQRKISVRSINRIIIRRATYDIHFGPVAF